MRWSLLSSVVAIVLVSVLSGQDGDDNHPRSAEQSFGTTVVAAGGLRGTVYLLPKNTAVLPDFEHDGINRVGEIWTETLNVPPRHWRSGFPGLTDRFEWFAIDYHGRFWIESPGRYTFALLSDDGSRLFIDDTPVIDNDCEHPPDVRVAAVKLDGGGHRIRVSYFQGPRDCVALVLAIAAPDHRWKVFSTREFKPPSNPGDWRYPEAGSLTLVPTTSDEASLSVDGLFQRITADDPEEKFVIRAHSAKGCAAAPVRFCGK